MQPGLSTEEEREQRKEGLTPSPDLLQMQEGAGMLARAGPCRGAGEPVSPRPRQWLWSGEEQVHRVGGC